jgi:hypothetical protein
MLTLHQFMRPRWRYGRIFGYVPEGPLFGWTAQRYRNLNSPFWQPNDPWHFANPNDPQRTSFNNHAWVEYATTQSRRVVDVCHALLVGGNVVLSDGSQVRATYIAQCIDQGAQTHTFGAMVVTRKSPLLSEVWHVLMRR